MQFTPIELADDQTLIDARGPIVAGDFHNFLALLNGASRRVVGIELSSPGGLIAEAARMAAVINAKGLPAVIAPGGGCASACFLMFAAAPRRVASPGAPIGVHRASQKGGVETSASDSATDLMGEQLRQYGVPSAIITRMEETPPDGVAWLTPDELDDMHVRIFRPRTVALPVPPQLDPHVVIMPGANASLQLPGTITPSESAVAVIPSAADFGLGD